MTDKKDAAKAADNGNEKKKKKHYPHYLTPLREEPSIKKARWGGVIEVQPVRVNLTLQDHCYTLKPANPTHFYLDSRGYECMEGATGAIMVNPSEVIIDGEVKGNPHIITRPDTGEILGAACRKVLLGVTPLGGIHMTERFIQLSLYNLWMMHLRSKIKYAKDAGETMSLAEFKELPMSKKKGHARLILQRGSDDWDTIVVVISLSHDLMIKAMDERMKLAHDLVKRAETICYRLTCSHSPLTRVDNIPVKNVLNHTTTGEKGYTKHFGDVPIHTYNITHTSRSLDLLGLAISVGDHETMRNLMESFSDTIKKDSKAIPESEMVDGVVDAEFEDEVDPDTAKLLEGPANPPPAETAPKAPPKGPKKSTTKKTGPKKEPEPESEQLDLTPAEPEDETPPAEPAPVPVKEPEPEPEPDPKEVKKCMKVLKKSQSVIDPEDFEALLSEEGVDKLDDLSPKSIIHMHSIVRAKYLDD